MSNIQTSTPGEAPPNAYTGTTVKMGTIKIARTDDQTIAIPRDMTLSSAQDAIADLEKAEEEPVEVHETIKAFVFDGAVAFMKALDKRYGFARSIATPGFFGPEPPRMVSIETGVGETIQIMWGRFKIPQIDGYLETGMTVDHGRMVFEITGQVRKKHEEEIAIVAALTRQIVQENSIYKGKAFRMTVDSDGDVDTKNAPTFIDVTDARPEELLFRDELKTQVETNLFTPIKATQACRNLQIPLKRGVLLEGKYGTGKTLTAYVTARACEENGWTFVMLDKVIGLASALELAKLYQPAVVFAEDIDRVIAGDVRTTSIDDVLNTIDGIGSKETEIITVLTTNHVEEINKAMLRPGRLDAVISVLPPDADTAIQLIHLYARELIDAKTDLSKAGKELDGQIPAVIREAVERAKLYSLTRVGGDVTKLVLTGDDIAYAAAGMKAHLALLAGTGEVEKTSAEKLGDALIEGLSGDGAAVRNIQDRLNSLCDLTGA